MMSLDTLNSNIKLYFPEAGQTDQLALSRVSFSAGTVEAASSGLPYAKHARIPVSKWRRPTPAEIAKLITPRPLQRGNCVALAKLLNEGELGQVQANLRAVRTRFGDPRE